MKSWIELHDYHISYLLAYAQHNNVECRSHLHHSMEIVLVTEGVLSMMIDGENFEISAGSGVFVSPYVAHSFRSLKPNTCHVIMFVKELMPQLFDFLQENQPKSCLFQFSDSSYQVAKKYLSESTDDLDFFHSTAILAPFVCDIMEQCEFSLYSQRHNDLFYKTVDYLSDHFTEEITLKSVAREVGIHPVTLSKLFADKFQNSFPSYLNYLRCSYAAVLLKTTNITCSEIAYQAGFGSIRSFNRIFFTFYGTTPTEFRSSS